MRNTNKKKLFLTETIKASDAYTDLNSFKTLEQEKRGIAWIQINLINNMEKKYIINSINNNDFGYVVVKEHPNKPIIVYRKGYRENAEELAKIASKYNGYLSGKATYEDSKRIGELLEYDPEDIQSYLSKNYKINNITEAENPKKKLFIPRGLSDDSDNRYLKRNKEQPIKDGVRINQYDYKGEKQGYWEDYYDNGELNLKGNYKDGQRDGYWEYYFDNGELMYKGTYKDDKEDGYWEWFYNNGQISINGSYKNGKEDGVFEHYWYDGELYKKESYKGGELYKKELYKDGELYNKELYKDGELYKKELYKDGKEIKNITESENPKKKLFVPRGLSDDSDNRYLKHNKEQPIKTINGEEIQINQYDIDGRKQGYWEVYYENGQLDFKGTYKDDKEEGYWECYRKNGQLYYKGNFKNGERDGYWEWYYDNGQLYLKGTYKNDKREGYWEEYFDNGQLESKGTYKNGKRDGYWEVYYENGQLWYKGTYKNGKREGYWEEYFDNGQLYYKKTYKNGKREGYWEEYFDNGQLYYKKTFKNDKEINNITESEKKKLFTPRGLSDDSDNRYLKHNKEQPIKDGVRINQYDYNGKKQGYWEGYFDNGQLESKGTYKNGKREGYWELWSKGTYKNGEMINNITESETPSFLLKEEIILIREGNVQDYINNVLTKIKNLPYETKKKYLTIAISTLLGYTSYPIIQSIVDNSPDKEAKEITDKIIKEKGNLSTFKDGTKLRLSKKGFQHIIDEEKPKLIAYNLGDGKITIGYGHAEPINNTKLKVGDKITVEQAKKYLKEDLKTAADGVRRMFSDWKQQGKNYKVTQDMFDALVSMAFNMGVSGLRQSQMIQYLKQGKYKTAGQLIKQTNINPDTFPGLEKRRYRESDMFLSYLSKPVDINA